MKVSNVSAQALEFLHGVGPWLLVFAAAATAMLLILLRPLLARHALARPNARSSHVTPTPQGAGAAIVAVTIASTAAILLWRGDGLAHGLCPVFAAVIFLALLGAIDDIRMVSVLPRLALQAIAVAAVVIALPDATRVFPNLPFALERTLLFLAGLWFINLSNFMDGLDWLTVSEVVPVTVGLAAAALLGGLPLYALVAALALCGAMLGFAPFNRPVARMFLGDVGSLPIGLLIGWLLVLLAGAGHFAAAFLLPLYFVADATLTLVRRAMSRQALWEAHRTHFYQRATDRGFRVVVIVGLVFATNCALAILSVMTILFPTAPVAAGGVVSGLALVGLLLVNFVRGDFLRSF